VKQPSYKLRILVQKNIIEIIAIGPRERIYQAALLILKKDARR
jgi:hypothetical protein